MSTYVRVKLGVLYGAVLCGAVLCGAVLFGGVLFGAVLCVMSSCQCGHCKCGLINFTQQVVVHMSKGVLANPIIAISPCSILNEGGWGYWQP